jgi:hypothetical protein
MFLLPHLRAQWLMRKRNIARLLKLADVPAISHTKKQLYSKREPAKIVSLRNITPKKAIPHTEKQKLIANHPKLWPETQNISGQKNSTPDICVTQKITPD